MFTAGFIGCGNMGGALAAAAAKSIGGKQVFLSDFIEEKKALPKIFLQTILTTRLLQKTANIYSWGLSRR